MRSVLIISVFLASVVVSRAETGEAAWLRYERIEDANVLALYRDLPGTVVTLNSGPVSQAAQKELLLGVGRMLNRSLRVGARLGTDQCFILGTLDSLHQAAPELLLPSRLEDDAYLMRTTSVRGQRSIVVIGANERGVLYCVFALLRKLALHQELYRLDEQHSPAAPVRWTNEWDNLDGRIERGYAGRSIFFGEGKVVPDLTRAGEYVRLLASVGINGCTVNNVNADLRVLTPDFISQLVRIADVFRPWGVRMSIAVDFSSPKVVGGLPTFDPLDPQVAQWWKSKADELYRAIPDLGGILLKADSEGRVGPSTYGRTHADAANVIARALKPHGGVLIYRGFVYNHHMDWRDLKNDRARAAFDNFAKLDGKFDDNVLVQVKYGPIDFQVREPVSPLIGALKHSNQTLEFQVTQEYTGQQRHVCFLLPMWKEILDFDFGIDGQRSTVKDIVAGQRFGRPLGGFVAVTNVGLDRNWLGNDLAMANLYAFGRVAWDPGLSSRRIVDEWTRLTFGSNQRVVETINNLQLRSWPVYEDYTGPLGIGGLTDIIGVHYGPGIESSERNGWGQWHRSDAQGTGMDRTEKSGTGYVTQYSPAIARQYESLASMPDQLLLFFHHVPYTHVLHSGETVIQHIYDVHYRGGEEAQTFPEQWSQLRGLIDDERFHAVWQRLEYQAGHAIVWRDAICNWFYKTSGIPDSAGRVGHHPHRIEAESMRLVDYNPVKVTPWETASGGTAVVCSNPAGCSAQAVLGQASGLYSIAIQYFAPNQGSENFCLFLDNQQLSCWQPPLELPSAKLDGHTSIRHTIANVEIRRGDTLRIAGKGEANNPAALDYIELIPKLQARIEPD